MLASLFAERFPVEMLSRRPLAVAVVAAAVLAASQAGAQQPQSSPEGRIIVIGTGSVHVPPDYAQIRSGVTTRAKTVKEATDANTKLMSTIMATLIGAGIAQTDIQTSRFSIQPVYTPGQPGVEAKLTGYAVSNQVEVTIRQIANVGDILDRLATAGATDAGSVAFLVSDPSKALDQARQAAVADARRKAELYASASGVSLGRVLWIEEAGAAPPVQFTAARQLADVAAPVPIAAGENTLQARITVGYDIAR